MQELNISFLIIRSSKYKSINTDLNYVSSWTESPVGNDVAGDHLTPQHAVLAGSGLFLL